MKALFGIVLICFCAQLQGKEIKLTFTSEWGNTAFESIDKVDSLTIDVLKFYVSSISFQHDGVEPFILKDFFYLIDFEDEGSTTIVLQSPDSIAYDQLSFCIGVDSANNVAGVLGGALDPTNGMYWTWNSGYINFKLEGTYAKLPTHGHLFDFHLGGYQTPYETLQTVSFTAKNEVAFVIYFDSIGFLKAVDFEHTYSITTPGKNAAKLANLLPQFFMVK